MLAHTLERLGGHPAVSGVVVALAADDRLWAPAALTCPVPLHCVAGGEERCHSVFNALDWLSGEASPDDWVLVHDAARPCVRHEDIEALIQTLSDHPVGGLLAQPVRDTIKQADSHGEVYATVERKGLWHALTPQMFRLEPLRQAVQDAIAAGVLVTDEAAAMERAGYRPKLVPGHSDNLKITHPDDLALAEFYLQRQTVEGRP